MSWQAQTAVNHHSKQANMGLFRLLLYLAECADETGRIDPAPSQPTIAEFLGVSDRTIRNRISQLCGSGELKQTRVGSGPGNPSAYQICLPMPENSGNDSGNKGGIKVEAIPGFLAAFEDFKAEVKAEILALKVEISAVKVEKVEAKGGNATGSKVKTIHYDPTSNQEEIYISPKPPCREDEITLQELPPEALPDFDDSQRVGEYVEAIGTQVRDYWGAAKNRKKFEEAAYMVIGFDATIELVMGFDSYWQEKGWYTTGGKASIDHFVDHWNDYINGVNLKKPTTNGKAPAVNDPYFAEIKPVGGRY